MSHSWPLKALSPPSSARPSNAMAPGLAGTIFLLSNWCEEGGIEGTSITPQLASNRMKDVDEAPSKAGEPDIEGWHWERDLGVRAE
jgi:hypothetical protein